MGFIFADEGEPSYFSLSNIYETVSYTIEHYGWYLLFFTILGVYIYNRKLKPILEKYKNYKFEQEYAAKYHKNPDLLNAHVTAQQKFVERLQEKYNKEAEQKIRQQKEKEERKRQEILSQLDTKGGGRLGDSSDAKKSTFKPEYNPLMGPGPSSSYRPPKRSACGGGGCGKK